MNNSELSVTDLEKDLGILVSSDLEWSQHINTAVGSANWQLGLIKFFSRIRMNLKLNCFINCKSDHIWNIAIWSAYCP